MPITTPYSTDASSHPEAPLHDAPRAESLVVDDPELSFLPPTGSGFLLKRQDHATLNHLAETIIAAPADLLTHVRRIRLALILRDAEHAFAALVDLYIATGQRALDLRTRLLRQSLALLNTDQVAHLLRCRLSGLSPTSAPDCRQSRLSAGWCCPDPETVVAPTTRGSASER